MRSLGLVAVGALLTAVACPAHADSCPVPEGASPALASVPPSRRLSFVTGALETAGEKSDRWGGFWRLTFQTSAIVHYVMADRTKNDATRIDLLAGAAKSSVGFVFALVFRLPAERHHDTWEARPWERGESLCTRLALAEAALAKDAKFEQRARGVGMQALGLSFNVAVGVATYLIHRRLWSTLSSMVVGGIVGEARVFTTPTVATDALADYSAGKLQSSKVTLSPVFLPQPGGGEVALSLSF